MSIPKDPRTVGSVCGLGHIHIIFPLPPVYYMRQRLQESPVFSLLTWGWNSKNFFLTYFILHCVKLSQRLLNLASHHICKIWTKVCSAKLLTSGHHSQLSVSTMETSHKWCCAGPAAVVVMNPCPATCQPVTTTTTTLSALQHQGHNCWWLLSCIHPLIGSDADRNAVEFGHLAGENGWQDDSSIWEEPQATTQQANVEGNWGNEGCSSLTIPQKVKLHWWKKRNARQMYSDGGSFVLPPGA